MNNQKTIRLATVNATGKKYIVVGCTCVYNPDKSLNLDLSKVQVWGELTGFRGIESRHDGSKTFIEKAVTITEVQKTEQLMKDLFEQGLNSLREQGYRITRTKKGNAKIYAPGTF